MIISGIIIVLLVIFDQVTKLLANNMLTLHTTNVIIPNMLEFNLLYNDGASFGILSGNMTFFMVITLVALFVGGYFFTQINLKTKKVFSYGVIFFIAGTFGNVIDRLRFQYVIDFIHIPFLPINFTFNIADLLLNVAVVLLFIDILFIEKKREKIDDQNN